MALDAANRMNQWGQWLQQGNLIPGVTEAGIEGGRYQHGSTTVETSPVEVVAAA